MLKSIIQKQQTNLSMYINWKIKSLQSAQDLRSRFSKNFKIEFDIKIQLKFLKEIYQQFIVIYYNVQYSFEKDGVQIQRTIVLSIFLISYPKYLKLGFVSNSFWTKIPKSSNSERANILPIIFCQDRKMCLLSSHLNINCLSLKSCMEK